jgi:hypothetical protein
MMRRFIEGESVIATLDPQTLVTTETAYTDTVDVSDYERVAFVLLTGTLNATSAVSIALQVNDATATDSTTWATTGVTAYTVTGVTDSEQAVVEIEATDMPSGKRYARALITAAADATGGPIAVVGIGDTPRYQPVDHLDSVSTYPDLS